MRIAYNLFTQKPKEELADFQGWAKQVKPGQGDDTYRHNGAGEMLLVRQERRVLGVRTVEAPAGLIDGGETPEAAARRELREEAGLDADMELLTRFYSSPGFCDEELLVYHARNLRESRLPMDEDEDIEVVWLPPEQVLAGLRDGSLVGSASTVTAALFAARVPA